MQCLDIFASSEIVIDLHTGVIDGLCGRVPLHSLRHSINHHFTPELSTPNVLLIMLLVDLKIHGIIHCTPRKFNRRFFIFDCLDYFRRNFEIEIQRNLAEEICWRFFNISSPWRRGCPRFPSCPKILYPYKMMGRG
jgi:hypothetical protein